MGSRLDDPGYTSIDVRGPYDGDVRDRTLAASRRRGYTLAETVIVVSLFGLLAAAVIPGLAGSANTHAVQGAVHEFRSFRDRVQSLAMERGRTVALVIDATSNRYWAEIDGTRVGEVQQLGDGIETAASDDRFCFDGRGLPTTLVSGCDGPAGTVKFVRGEETAGIEFSSGGAVEEVS